MKTAKQIKESIAEKRESLQGIVNTLSVEKRDRNEVETNTWNTTLAEISNLEGELRFAEQAEANASALALRTATNVPLDSIKKPDRDIKKYSVLRALNSAANNQPLSGIELEMHQEAQKEVREFGESLQGVGVPSWYAKEKRAATAGTNSEGGYTIQTDLGSLIDVVYDQTFTAKLGARVMRGLTGNIALPTQTAKLTVATYAENAQISASDLTFGQSTLSPARDGAVTIVSKMLLQQSSIDVEAYIADMLATQFILKGELRAYTAIAAAATELTIASSTNGIAPAYAHLLAQEQALAVANIRQEFGYLTNPKVRAVFKQTAQLSNTIGMPVWGADDRVAGYKTAVSNILPSNLTKGSGSSLSAAIMGDFKEYVTGYWGGMDYTVDPYSLADYGEVKIVAQMFTNGLVTRAAAFSKISQYITG